MSHTLVDSINKFVEGVANFGSNLLFFNIFPFYGIKIPFLIAWLVIASAYFFIGMKMYNMKFAFFAFKYGTSKSVEKIQREEVKKSKLRVQTSRAISLFSVGSNADLGSIFGVAVAISIGGRGVIFWMLIVTLISSSIRVFEVFVAHSMRKKSEDGSHYIGGPQFYIVTALKKVRMKKLGSVLAFVFSMFLILSTFCSVQMNQTVMIFSSFAGLEGGKVALVSLVISAFVAIVLLYGFEKIASFSDKYIPVIGFSYFLATTIVIIFNYKNIIPSFKGIFIDAFSLKAGISGFISSIVLAAQRAMFCSETGMGSAPISHINSVNKNSLTEATISAMTPLLSVFIVCFCSGLIISVTEAYKIKSSGVDMMIQSFATVHPKFPLLLLLIIPTFGISTAVAWAYYGQRLWIDYFGESKKNIYRALLFISYWVCGTSTNFNSILAIADFLGLAITIPNVFSLYFFYPNVKKEFSGAFSEKTSNIDSFFKENIK